MFPIFTSANLLVLCSQNNLTDGKEDLPEDTFSLLSVLLVGSLNFPFDRSRLAPRRQPSRRTFTRKLWSKLAIYLSLSISLSIYLCFPPISFFILPSLLNNSTHNSFFSPVSFRPYHCYISSLHLQLQFASFLFLSSNNLYTEYTYITLLFEISLLIDLFPYHFRSFYLRRN